MEKNRMQYQIKRTPMGDRLIWRYPGSQPAVRRQLQAAGVDTIPASITLGYYRVLDQPPGAIAFMPVNTAAAAAALGIESVQMRICEDLQIRMRAAAEARAAAAPGDAAPSETPDLLQCPRCERQVAPIDDDGDLLCGRCRLVLYAE